MKCGPSLKLASMYIEQFQMPILVVRWPKHNVPLFDTIEKRDRRGDRIPVDGVISIGEHGDYLWNDKDSIFIHGALLRAIRHISVQSRRPCFQ